MKIWRSSQCDFARRRARVSIVSRLGRIRYEPGDVSLIHQRVRPVVALPPRETKIVRNTVQKTVVHMHQTVLKQTFRQITAANYLRQDAFLLVLPRIQPSRREPDYSSRPTKSAQMLMRIFSRESARRELRPFYSDVVRGVLKEEQERYKSRPTKAISLIWNLFGRPNAFRTLTRFYLGAVERLGSNYFPALNRPNTLYLAAGVLTHSRVYRRYIYHLWNRVDSGVPLRYAAHAGNVAEDLMHLPVAKRSLLPSKQVVERLLQGAEREQDQRVPAPAPERGPQLSESQFRALVRGVADSLSRRSRLDSLQRGGY